MTLTVVRKAFLLDVDGTVANNAHRQHHLDKKPKDWKGFFSELSKDTPKVMVLGVAQMMATTMGLHPVVLTGRAEEHREETAQWLIKHAPWLGPSPLFMRADDDKRPDTEYKKQLYLNTIKPRYDVQVIFEDRASVVAMWRSLGLECWQVAAGDF